MKMFLLDNIPYGGECVINISTSSGIFAQIFFRVAITRSNAFDLYLLLIYSYLQRVIGDPNIFIPLYLYSEFSK